MCLCRCGISYRVGHWVKLARKRAKQHRSILRQAQGGQFSGNSLVQRECRAVGSTFLWLRSSDCSLYFYFWAKGANVDDDETKYFSVP